MRSIPPSGSIPSAIRGRRIIPAGREQSSWDGKPGNAIRKRQKSFSLSLCEQMQIHKRVIAQIEESMRELKDFAQEGIEVGKELANLSRRKKHWEELLI